MTYYVKYPAPDIHRETDEGPRRAYSRRTSFAGAAFGVRSIPGTSPDGRLYHPVVTFSFIAAPVSVEKHPLMPNLRNPEPELGTGATAFQTLRMEGASKSRYGAILKSNSGTKVGILPAQLIFPL